MNVGDHLAGRNDGVEWSGIRVMFELADQIPDVINLGIGQPDFDTPEHIRDAAKVALDEGYTRYPPAKGFADLREAIAAKAARENGITADPAREIFVAVGAMQVIFNAMLHLVDPGDEVILFDPGYDYYSQIRLFGGVPVAVPVVEGDGFRVDPDRVRNAVTDRTRLIILNTPSNPTGAVLDREILGELSEIVAANDLLVLSDEPYEHILFDGREHVSFGSVPGMAPRTISAFTLSKSYAMTGWRVGYAIAPAAVVDEMEKLMEHMVSGVTAVAQRAALAAITMPQGPVTSMVAEYAARRRIVFEGLNAIDGVSCLEPEATFYAFPNISGVGPSSWDFARDLVREERVAVVPGPVFGPGGEGYVRLSFAAATTQLEEGLERFAAGVARMRGL
ncbi:MAG: pyridoxal phosphate-dependent aminotransferase [Acidimicrobiia bacterium]